MSHPAWGAWIEIKTSFLCLFFTWSHPAWGAWIEIILNTRFLRRFDVAPRVGCVD